MSSIRNILALTLFVIITCSRLEAQELAKLDESHLINEWHLFKRDTTGADYYDLTERRGPGITFKYNGDLVVDNGPI